MNVDVVPMICVAVTMTWTILVMTVARVAHATVPARRS